MKNNYHLLKSDTLKLILIWFTTICVLIQLLLFVKTNYFTIAVIRGDSMYPTLQNGDIILVDKIHTKVSRGDVILAEVSPNNKGSEYIVKRVIATGGEDLSIDYNKNSIIIDGFFLSEPYINQDEVDPLLCEGGVETVNYAVPEGFVFIMGDNRNFSSDSRNEEIGPIPEDKIIGKVICPHMQ